MTVRDPVWVSIELVEAVHERQIAEHGGGTGIRDKGMLESAIARPQQLQVYGGEEVDIPALAAAYAYGIARNHAFVDGNKRTAYVVMRLFLVINGWDIVAPMPDRYATMLALAAGEISEAELADWLRANSRPEQINEPGESYA